MSVETRGRRAARTHRKSAAPKTSRSASAQRAKEAVRGAARAAMAAIEASAPPEHDPAAAYLDERAIPPEKLDMIDVGNAAQAVFGVHESLKALNEILWQAGRGKFIGCLKLYCLLDLMERELFSALDLLRAYTPLIPDEG